MDDAFLVRVLDGVANFHEQLQPLLRGESVHVAVVGDGHAFHQLHHEIGPARGGRSAVEDAGDVGMLHHGKGLPFGLETGHDLAGIHA